KDGSIMWGKRSVSGIRDYDGAPTHLVAHVTDVTGERDAPPLFASTFCRSVVPMLVLDDNRNLVELTQACADLLGLQHDEAVGLSIDSLLTEDKVEDVWPRFVEAGRLESEVWLHR